MTNGKKVLITIVFSLLLLLYTEGVHALQTITLTEGESTFVDISQRDLNLIRFSFSNIKVYTSSKVLDIKIDGSNVFVGLSGDSPALGGSAPQEVFFVTSHGTYSLILVPKGIPAETIIVRTPGEDISDAIQWENSHDYITGLKELIKSMYVETPPMGFSVKEINKKVTRWQGTKQILLFLYSGATLEGEVHKLTNISDKPIRILESEFYQKGVLAVSIDRHELSPDEETRVYIIKRHVVSKANLSEAQKQMDQFLKKQNPLDVLKEN